MLNKYSFYFYKYVTYTFLIQVCHSIHILGHSCEIVTIEHDTTLLFFCSDYILPLIDVERTFSPLF